MIKKTLLIEIGTEELPARLLDTISSIFFQNVSEELKVKNVSYEEIKLFFTPRRLALKIIDIDTTEKIIEKNKKGPLIKNAYDKNGLPTQAANQWAKYNNINLKQAKRIKNKKEEWLSYCIKIKQENIETLIPKITENALKKIIIPKSMRWNINNERFCRPIRNIVLLLDDKVITSKIFNIISNNILYNHISGKEKKIFINNVKEYPFILFKENKIIADSKIRKRTIIQKINQTAKKINGFLRNSSNLIKETNFLLESPEVFLASFDRIFLKIPEKILVHTIEKKQKCFPVYNIKKEILPYFIFFANISTQKTEKIIKGYEQVMHARLSDAEFFFNQDRKIKLEDNLLSLKKVLFYNKLGSLYEKTMRIKSLIMWIAKYNSSNIEDCIKSALLSKCDLTTNMVSEFPELQGTIGMYYALEEQEKKEVAIALEEQYLPSFSGDALPTTLIGCSLSIADKIDTLSGMFSIGKIPNSEKDPFALRRLAIGILRIIIVKKISLNLQDLINKSLFLHDKKHINNFNLYNKIIKFFMRRLFYWYQETGYSSKIIKSVLSCKLIDPIEIDKKIKALSFFIQSKKSKLILLSIKRTCNMLAKEKKIISNNINIQLIQEQEEKILFNEIKNFDKNTKNLFKEKKYKEILLEIQNFEKPIYHFFNNIKIHHSNPDICLNRLILLNHLKNIFFKIANFSYLY